LSGRLNEITDNVLVHAQSPIGGLVQVSTFKRTTKRIEYIVVDAGIGIPKTLRQSHPELSDAAALENAIKQGVTRDKLSAREMACLAGIGSAAIAGVPFIWSPAVENLPLTRKDSESQANRSLSKVRWWLHKSIFLIPNF
jgi:hypothetical protein